MASNKCAAHSKDGVTLTESVFGKLKGDVVKKFTWKTAQGLEVVVISYGAIIQSIKLPDRNGVVKDIVLGFEDVDTYVAKNTPDLLGCVVGRSANRTLNGTFEIDGQTYNLTKNYFNHSANGGLKGFDKVNWLSTIDGPKVIFSYLSKDGEEGYPGDLITNITYEVRSDNTLHLQYRALTTKKTLISLTNHAYFNLAGHNAGRPGVEDHTIVVNSDRYLDTDKKEWIPTGKFVDVAGTPTDLRITRRVGDGICNDEDVRYHQTYVINSYGNKEMSFASRLHHPPSGRFLEVYSNQPTLIFYTANFMEESRNLIGKGGALYGKCSGIALEPLNYVDAIHNKNFSSPILCPGQIYKNDMYFNFGAK